MGLEEKLGFSDFFTTKTDALLNWARKNSLWPMPFGTACCAIEMMATMAARYDLARFGAEVLRFSPRQSDMLIVSGRVSIKMVPILRRIYGQMPDPKWVISMGACASTGGVFNAYPQIQGVDQFLPVDVYIPGCPPHPEDLIEGLLAIQRKVDQYRNTGRHENAPEVIEQTPWTPEYIAKVQNEMKERAAHETEPALEEASK